MSEINFHARAVFPFQGCPRTGMSYFGTVIAIKIDITFQCHDSSLSALPTPGFPTIATTLSWTTSHYLPSLNAAFGILITRIQFARRKFGGLKKNVHYIHINFTRVVNHTYGLVLLDLARLGNIVQLITDQSTFIEHGVRPALVGLVKLNFGHLGT